MHAVSRGRVSLRSADPTVLPRVEHGLLTDPDGHDLAVLEEGAEVCRAVAATPEWRYWCGPETVPGPEVTGRALRDWIRANSAGTYHPCGTARMGRADHPASVVDGTGRVLGTEGLVVADASIFPSIPAANIHVSVVAAAEKIAADLRRV
jgi:choline dehydrogenase